MELIQENKIRHLPIVDEGQRLIGLISDRDILKALSPIQEIRRQKDGEQFREYLFRLESKESVLSETVTSISWGDGDPTSVAPDTSLKNAISTLLEDGISCLPVADQSRRIHGIFTSADVMHAAWAAFRFSDQTV